MKNRRILMCGILLTSLITLTSWQTQPPPSPSLTVLPTGNQGEYTFILKDLPAFASNAPATSRYKVFLNTDDGGWYIREGANLATTVSITHTYAASGTKTPTIEYVPIYDDTQTDPPPVRIGLGTADTPFSPNGSGANSFSTPFTGRVVDIQPVWNLVPEHKTTFVLTFRQPDCANAPATGILFFDYDASVMELDQTVTTSEGLLAYQTGVDNVASASNLSPQIKRCTIPVNTISSGAQRSYILKFQTKSTAQVNQTLVQVPKVSYVPSSPAGFCNHVKYDYALTDLTSVKNAHDPNYKTIRYYMDGTTPKLEYMIHFQNDGNAPVEKITISDELDPLLDCVNSVHCFSPWLPQQIIAVGPDRKFNIGLNYTGNGNGLRGKKEHGYGKTFSEEETKSYVKVTMTLCNNNLPHCTAILNRASIRFNCNPPIETDLAILNINCTGEPDKRSSLPSPAPVAPGYISPPLCSETIIFYDSAATLPMVPATIDLSTYTHLKWYPESGLNLTNPAQPILTTPKNTTYALVASGNCKRLIFIRKVRVPCTLALSPPTITGYSPGPGAPDNFVISCSTSVNNVQWQDCSIGSSYTYQSSSSKLGPGTYYFSVYDEATGCYDEKWVSTLKVSDNPNDCDANLKIEGAYPSYSYLWEYTEGGAVKYSTAQALPNLQGKTGITVTVTDAQGNTAVFSPGKKCYSVPSILGGKTLAIAVAVLLFAVAAFFVIKSNK